ncbi:hypothetical protein ACFO25_04055 [Paenactinomyces guangxiensis]|uniref:Uncharacterized protein n=1 Tax=Paenactinomyces guangxiensis TaxID=1490290 RepID=A0A7W1WNV2_9BACL|nr:hypothetical protein [Paenactinomyces guangxiensis]MBA4493330.1 hypothetical protein [Paenactinomyces guangxiensis]
MVYSGEYDFIFLDNKLQKVRIHAVRKEEYVIDPTPDKEFSYPKWLVSFILKSNTTSEAYKVEPVFDQSDHLLYIDLVSHNSRKFSYASENTHDYSLFHLNFQSLPEIKNQSLIKGYLPLQNCAKALNIEPDKLFKVCGKNYALLVMDETGNIRIEYSYPNRRVEYVFMNNRLVYVRTYESKTLSMNPADLKSRLGKFFVTLYGYEYQRDQLHLAIDLQSDGIHGFTLYSIPEHDLEWLIKGLGDQFDL